MTLQEMLDKQNKPRRKPKDEEHKIQCACVKWFRLQFPKMSHNLFAIPNGSKRDPVTAAKLKAEGVLSGVADIIFLKPNRFYGGLLIELKTPTGRQSENQKLWQNKITEDGYKYVIVRSLDDFKREIKSYMEDY